MKPLNKYQVETAEQTLRNALNNKASEICKTKLKEAYKKHETKVKSFFKKAQDLRKEMETYANKLPQELLLEMSHKSYGNDWQQNLPEASEKFDISYLLKEKDHKLTPDFDKEYAEINQFVLGLKLGTAVMTDLQPLLDKINKLK